MNKHNKKILFITGREYNYTRNMVLLNAISKNRHVINISSNNKNYLIRYMLILLRLLLIKITLKKFDIVFIGFYGHPLVFLIKLFSNKPIIFDAFISTYQTLCIDRKKFPPNSIVGKLAYFIDKYSCVLADLVILDTNAHIKYFAKTFNINSNKFRRIFVGADENIFFPKKIRKTKTDKKIVLFYGEYQPLHGIEYIIKAAKLVKDNNIIFKIIGIGRDKQKILKLAKKIEVQNVEFIDWIPYSKLPVEIANSDICLGGHFGKTNKANMVIAGKVFQTIAMKKPTLLSLTDSNQELFPETDSIYYVKQGNPKELASKINFLISNKKLLNNVATKQYQVYRRYASNSVINDNILSYLI